MNAYVTGLAGGAAVGYSPRAISRIEAHIRSNVFDRPTLVLDTDVVAANYRALKAGLGRASVHYAVKANPEAAIIDTLPAIRP